VEEANRKESIVEEEENVNEYKGRWGERTRL